MTATVISFSSYRRQPIRPRFRDTAKGDLAQEAMAEYAHHPVSAMDEAIRAGWRAIDAGGSFLDAMDAMEAVINARCRPATETELQMLQRGRNIQRLAVFRARRNRLAESLLTVVSRQIRHRLQGHDEREVHNAIVRARRVLEGGGTPSAAIYHAISAVL